MSKNEITVKYVEFQYVTETFREKLFAIKLHNDNGISQMP